MGISLNPGHYLLQARSLEPDNPKFAYLHGEYLIKEKKPTKAIDYIESFLSEFGPDANLQNLLALAYLNLENIEKAEESIGNALSKLPRSKDFLRTAFLIKKAKGDKISAFHFLERIVRMDEQPFQTFDIFWEMAQLLDSKTEIKKKINLLEISLSLNHKNTHVLEELILTYCEIIETGIPKSEKAQFVKDLYRLKNNPMLPNLTPLTLQKLALIVG